MAPWRARMFRDRAEAGRMLASRLKDFKGQNPVVLALPRGGVPVGYEIAVALRATLDVIVARKLGAPGDPELAIGAVVGADEPETVLNEELISCLGVEPEYLAREIASQLKEIRRREAIYRGGRRPAALAGRTAIVVDDGVATGASIRAALRGVRRRGAQSVVLAVPVAPPEVAASLAADAQAVIILLQPEPFMSVGSHYEDFAQTPDEEVMRLLEAAAMQVKGPAARPIRSHGP